jgi:hypothetical protein
MPILPSGVAPWIEPANSGAAVVARIVLITETSAGVFELDAGTGTSVEAVERAPGVLQLIPSSGFASFVESPTGVFTPTPGTGGATPIVESPAGVFTPTPSGVTTAQLVQTATGVYEIISTSARRATAFRLGATNKTLLY